MVFTKLLLENALAVRLRTALAQTCPLHTSSLIALCRKVCRPCFEALYEISNSMPVSEAAGSTFTAESTSQGMFSRFDSWFQKLYWGFEMVRFQSWNDYGGICRYLLGHDSLQFHVKRSQPYYANFVSVFHLWRRMPMKTEHLLFPSVFFLNYGFVCLRVSSIVFTLSKFRNQVKSDLWSWIVWAGLSAGISVYHVLQVRFFSPW